MHTCSYNSHNRQRHLADNRQRHLAFRCRQTIILSAAARTRSSCPSSYATVTLHDAMCCIAVMSRCRFGYGVMRAGLNETLFVDACSLLLPRGRIAVWPQLGAHPLEREADEREGVGTSGDGMEYPGVPIVLAPHEEFHVTAIINCDLECAPMAAASAYGLILRWRRSREALPVIQRLQIACKPSPPTFDREIFVQISTGTSALVVGLSTTVQVNIVNLGPSSRDLIVRFPPLRPAAQQCTAQQCSGAATGSNKRSGESIGVHGPGADLAVMAATAAAAGPSLIALDPVVHIGVLKPSDVRRFIRAALRVQPLNRMRWPCADAVQGDSIA